MPGSDTPVEKIPLFLLLLATANDELVVGRRHIQIVLRKTGDCNRDTQAFRYVFSAGQALDVVWRIAIIGLRHTLQRFFHGIKTQQKRVGEWRHAAHIVSVLATKRRFAVPLPATLPVNLTGCTQYGKQNHDAQGGATRQRQALRGMRLDK
ncbi:hypothetical protein AGR1A_Cc20053 [Agrobacterium fabacearum CFBP 5771]|nr:hypothetical protein AGR1A_Cc20053 [Agrobacterium fabacearum CFBP 5771]